MARYRCAVAGICHESNTFSTLRTELRDFRVWRGDELLDLAVGDRTPDIEWVPTLVASAAPHGVVSRDAYLTLRSELIESLERGMPYDGVLLNLHGAMEVEDIGDGEGIPTG